MIRQTSKAAGRRCVTPEDLRRFRIVSDPRISPDGSRIVFVEKHAAEGSQYAVNLWMVGTGYCAVNSVPARNGRPVGPAVDLQAASRFTDGGGDSSPRWSPDGACIAFVRATERTGPQIYLISATGGEARKLSDFPEGSISGFRWSPDGKWLGVRFRPQEPQWTEAAKKEREQRGLSDPPRVVEDLWHRYDGEGYFGTERHALYLVDADNGRHQLIYGEDTLGHFSFDFSPDSRQLIVATNRSAEPTLCPWEDEIVRVRVATGRVTPIRGLPAGPKTSVRWSPDGTTIAYAGRLGKDPAYSTENLELFVCHATRGGARSLTAGYDYCLQAEGLTDMAPGYGRPKLQFSPGGERIFLRLSWHGESHMASIPARGGELVFHTHGVADVRLGNLSADGAQIALAVGGPTTLAEVAVADCRTEKNKGAIGRNGHARSPHGAGLALFPVRVLTDMNASLRAELKFSMPEPHWIRAEDGHPVQVWILRPPCVDLSAGKKVPAILGIHGGPHAQYCSSLFQEFQVMAAAGYAVFYSNPRGSKGYGRDHCAAIRGQWGTADWNDIQAVIGFMKEQPFVDRRRLGVMGGSYGGYMTNWAISHCRDFAAAITDRSLCNLVSMSGTTDFIEPPSEYYSGNFWDQPEARWDQSPLKYLGQVKTPTLIIHSEGDLRCSIEQAEQLFTVLKLLGVPTRFVRYPVATSHGMSRNGPPDLRIHRLHEMLAWWEKYLRPARRGSRRMARSQEAR